MRSIFKYDLHIDGLVEVEMPKSAEVVHVGAQDPTGRTIQMWAIVDTEDEDFETREFVIVGTGHPLAGFLTADKHIATVITAGGALVWHVFKEPSNEG